MNVRPTIDRNAATPRDDNRILAIASGKGGVGKTWLSITLAQAFARRSKRVLVFDGDLGLANIDIQLGLMPETDLQSVFAGRTGLKAAVTPYKQGGFDLIAGRSGSGGLASLPMDRLEALCDRLVALAEDYDHVLIDLGAGVEMSVRQLARPASTILVITTDEPTSLTDAYAFIKLTARDHPGADMRIVVNMAQSTGAGEHTYGTLAKACHNFLKFTPPLAGIVRRDAHVPDCIRHQTPLLSRHPNSEAAGDVESIVERLVRQK